jgi:methionyl-tRNA formyltransferase
MLKVVFAGTPEFAKTALNSIEGAGHQIVLVMTQPDRPAGRGMSLQASPVKQFALEKGIPVLQPHSLKIDGRYAAEAKATLHDLDNIDFDVMVVAAYGLILPKEVFEIAERGSRAGCLNIHASLLPRWRGAAPIHRAIEAGDSVTGISIMQMDLGLDTGPVIAMKEVAIQEHKTTASLHDDLALLGGEMIVEALAQFEKNHTLHNAPQDSIGVTYANKILKDEARIDWKESAEKLDCKIRAFNPFPGANFEKDDQVIKVWSAKKTNLPSDGRAPGEIIAIEREGIHVATGSGILLLTELQKPGAKRGLASQLAQGLAWKPGQKLFR